MANRICKFPAIPATGLCVLVFAHSAAAGLTVTRVDFHNLCHNYTDSDGDDMETISNPLDHLAVLDAGATNVDAVYQLSWDESTGYGSFHSEFVHHSTDLAFSIDSLNYLDLQLDTPQRMRVTGSVEMHHAPDDFSSIDFHLEFRADGQPVTGQHFSAGTDWANGVSSGAIEFDETIDLPAGIELEISNYIWSDSQNYRPGFFDAFGEFTITFAPVPQGGNTCHDDGFSEAASLEAIPLPVETRATSNTYNFYGYVCVFGDTIIAGNATDMTAGSSAGAAYLYRHTGGRWYEDRTLLPSDAQAGDMIGFAVAVADDTAIVGAPRDDDDGENSGSVYVFERINDLWPESAKLRPADGAAANEFGTSIAMDGDIAVVGAKKGDGAATDSGAAYVFRRIAGAWQEEAKLTATDAATNNGFGTSVSISGDTIIVGATRNGSRGAAYVFRYDDGAWHQEARLADPFGEDLDYFGVSVSIDGDLAVIGAPGTMSAHVFRRTGTTWAHETNLSPSAYPPTQFGQSVSISGNLVVVGDPYAPGTPGVSFMGAASVFLHDGDDWLDAATLRAVDVHSPLFGVSLSIDGGSIVCGGVDQALVGPRFFELTTSGDCNQNLVPDECDIDGVDPDNDGLVSADCNGDGIPDECRTPGDTNGDGMVDLGDVAGFVAEALGQVVCRFGDFNADGTTDGHDVGLFAAALLGS